ncbi:hypothetical protein N7520_011605 [Penicillium odoratum]|uniref:uncharacterized protein n=1 Tax=Penicillium odoratum TaxID=1167516 RepID=UPI0025472A8F|nr:uncharacterized protein N7520_011605 [Penicillium odoratum]KAJ5746423.1 hypothetical protein N7520_011605 [Penicillium odoratum]
METSPSQSGTPAPYGRACSNCSRAKSKCILLVGRGCERCQRLKKDCRPSPTVRKRISRSSTSKTAQLEAKLDSIVSLLQTTGSNPGLAVDWDSSASGSKQPSPFNFRGADMPSPAQTASSPNTASIVDACTALQISPEIAEKTINDFRKQNLKMLPFLHIPPHVTSQQLRNDKPFLWLCIMAVCTPGESKRNSLFAKVTDLFHQELILGSSPSMDILLGTMTYVSWTTFTKRPFLNFYAHMVMGLICDMGINKAVPKDLSAMQAFKCAVGWQQHINTIRTLEERRVVLGCFLITSSVALALNRIDALRWSPHMEESLTVLIDSKECPEDEILVNLVKIQLVYQARRDGDDQLISRFYIKSFQAQLDVVRKQIPAHLQQNENILMHVFTAELIIHEWAIQAPADPQSPELYRLESLCAALHATKNWLDVWLSVSPLVYLGMPFTTFFQFSRVIVSLFKLSTLDDPGWDKTMVRNTANILDYLDRTGYNMKRCIDNTMSPDDADWSVLEKGIKMVQSIKQGWEPKLMEVWYPSLPSTGLNGDEFVPPAPDLAMLPIDGLDDAWMMQIFGSL